MVMRFALQVTFEREPQTLERFQNGLLHRGMRKVPQMAALLENG